MLKEIRKIKEKPKRTYIYFLVNENKIPKHINEKGYVCYDTDELKAFKKTHKKGRPPKIKLGE